MAQAPGLISKSYKEAAVAAGKSSAMTIVGRLTGAISLYDDYEKGSKAWQEGDVGGVIWNLTKGVATTIFLFGGGEEVELGWNLLSMGVDALLGNK